MTIQKKEKTPTAPKSADEQLVVKKELTDNEIAAVTGGAVVVGKTGPSKGTPVDGFSPE